MGIHFNCECGNAISVAEKYAGKRARCNKCGKIIVVPASGTTGSAVPVGQGGTAASGPATPQASASGPWQVSSSAGQSPSFELKGTEPSLPQDSDEVIFIPVAPASSEGRASPANVRADADADEVVFIPVSGEADAGGLEVAQPPAPRGRGGLLVAGIVAAVIALSGGGVGAYVYFAKPSLPSFASKLLGRDPAPAVSLTPSAPERKPTVPFVATPPRTSPRTNVPSPLRASDKPQPKTNVVAPQPKPRESIADYINRSRFENQQFAFWEMDIANGRILGQRFVSRTDPRLSTASFEFQNCRFTQDRIIFDWKCVVELDEVSGTTILEMLPNGDLQPTDVKTTSRRRQPDGRLGEPVVVEREPAVLRRAGDKFGAAGFRRELAKAARSETNRPGGPPREPVFRDQPLRSAAVSEPLLIVEPAALSRFLDQPGDRPVVWVQLTKKDTSDDNLKRLREWVEQGGILWLDTDLARSFRFPLVQVLEERQKGQAKVAASGRAILGGVAPDTEIGYGLSSERLAVRVSTPELEQTITGLLGWTVDRQNPSAGLPQQTPRRRGAARLSARAPGASAQEPWFVCAVRTEGRGAVVYRPREIDTTADTGRRFEESLRAYRPAQEANPGPRSPGR